MDELEEAASRKRFYEATAKYRRAKVAQPGVWAEAWTPATQAAEEAEKLQIYWAGQSEEWDRLAMEEVPEDEPDRQ